MKDKLELLNKMVAEGLDINAFYNVDFRKSTLCLQGWIKSEALEEVKKFMPYEDIEYVHDKMWLKGIAVIDGHTVDFTLTLS